MLPEMITRRYIQRVLKIRPNQYRNACLKHCCGGGAGAVVGGPGEREQCLPLLDAPGIPIIDRVGKTSVGELMAIIEHAQLVVANASAALHIALKLVGVSPNEEVLSQALTFVAKIGRASC